MGGYLTETHYPRFQIWNSAEQNTRRSSRTDVQISTIPCKGTQRTQRFCNVGPYLSSLEKPKQLKNTYNNCNHFLKDTINICKFKNSNIKSQTKSVTYDSRVLNRPTYERPKIATQLRSISQKNTLKFLVKCLQNKDDKIKKRLN